MQGRLMGKRLTGRHFYDWLKRRLALARLYMRVNTLPIIFILLSGIAGGGYEISSVDTGYSDCQLCADLNSLHLLPWSEGAVLAISNPHVGK
uniref:Uncharacterized protein n=1 Tax=Meloidogyne floridensis TaxID=298350 RepID=A0A915P4B6_9BILA